ncbi:hypothetical protein RJT34_20703 [Clitoria ternatea]|uniref:Uncharacterized protein n=1 Tax=Clitoria ternatea TaxID=43366 RepID=A0AAN9ITM0_CLITE
MLVDGACIISPREVNVYTIGDGINGCYLVDPASIHMLVSKIKPCMCKYEQIQTVKLRMAHSISYSLFDVKKLVVGPWVGLIGLPLVCIGWLVPSAGDAPLALIGRVVPLALLL